MLTITLEFSWRASSTKLMWPACRAPMVGTSPMVSPSRCHRRETSRIVSGASRTARELSGPVPDLLSLTCNTRSGSIGRVFVLGTREDSASNFLRELLSGRSDLIGQMGISLDEFGRLASGQAQQVVED